MPLLNMNDECCEKACDDFESKRIPKISDVPDFLDCPYFITGSVKFGCATRHSDLDIAIPIKYKSNIFKPEYSPSEYNAGFKFMHEDICINIIPLRPLDYVAWNHAAKIISVLGIFKPILLQEDESLLLQEYGSHLSKYKRYSLHEMYVAASKMSIGQYNIDWYNYEKFLKF